MRSALAQTPGPNLFLRHLPPNMLETELEAVLSPHGRVKRLTVWKDHQTRQSKCFGMAEFETTEGAVKAMNALQGRELDGSTALEIEYHHGKRRVDGSPDIGAPCTNMYIRGLPLSMTEEQLRDVLRNYGEIKRLTIWKDQFGRSKGFGMCEYGSPEQARMAMERLRGQTLDNQTALHVEVNPPKPAQPHQQTQMGGGYGMQAGVQGMNQVPIPNLYIGGFPLNYQENELQELVQPYGQVKRVTVWRDRLSNTSKGFGLVEFGETHQATAALNALNGMTIDGHNTPLKVEYNYPKKKYSGAAAGGADASNGQTQCSNIFLKCLPLHVGDAELQTLLSPFGRIARSTVWKDQQTQQSRGFGFCEFASPASANEAIRSLNGVMLQGAMTPIHVELHTKQGNKGGHPAHGALQQQPQHQPQQPPQQLQQQLLASVQPQQTLQNTATAFAKNLPRYDDPLKGVLDSRYNSVWKDRSPQENKSPFGQGFAISDFSTASIGQLQGANPLAGLEYHHAASNMGQPHAMHPSHHRPTFP